MNTATGHPDDDHSAAAPAAHAEPLDLTASPVELTRRLVDIPSESHHERDIADALEAALAALRDRLAEEHPDQEAPTVERFGNTLVARTRRGLGHRVVLAGHVDTVPAADNLPSRTVPDPAGGPGEAIAGLGSVDMKSGDAVFLHAFATLAASEELAADLTLVLYEGEEVATRYNGLNHLAQDHPDLIQGDVAILGEPSGAVVEAGCQGTVRVKVTAHGRRAHSARSWLGSNAIHSLGRVIARVADYEPRQVDIDGCVYREGLNVVVAEAGVATNTVPDEAWMFVNLRFAPDRSVEDALAHTWEVLGVGTPDQPAEGFSLEVDDAAPGALPGLDRPAAAGLVEATGGSVRAKYGWTDVARFAQFGIPAVNFGPGDPGLCHTPEENCPVHMIETVSAQVLRYLTGGAGD